VLIEFFWSWQKIVFAVTACYERAAKLIESDFITKQHQAEDIQ